MSDYTNSQLTIYVDDILRRLAEAEAQIAALAEQAGVTVEVPQDEHLLPARTSADTSASELATAIRAGDRTGAIARYRALSGAGPDDPNVVIATI